MVLNKCFGTKCRYWLEVKEQIRPNSSGETGGFPDEQTRLGVPKQPKVREHKVQVTGIRGIR